MTFTGKKKLEKLTITLFRNIHRTRLRFYPGGTCLPLVPVQPSLDTSSSDPQRSVSHVHSSLLCNEGPRKTTLMKGSTAY